jgi:endoglucanase
VNLGNYLEAPPGDDWGARYTADDFDNIRKEGFDHVRIPVGWHHYTGHGPDYALRPAIFQKADELIDHAMQRGLNVIVNVHHFDAFTTNPSQERSRLLAIWRQLSQHYAKHEVGLSFELLNEPKDAATTEVLNEIYPECIAEIRRTNPQRTIFVGPGLWNATGELPKLKLPDDETNVIVTVHSYLPMYFTHQGTSWTGPDFALTGVQFPGPPAQPLRLPPSLKLKPYVVEWMSQYNNLPTKENPSSPQAFALYLEQAQMWSEHYGRPVHLGEFGATDKADNASRARYCRAVRVQCEAAGMGWALWDWKAGFRYWDASRRRPMPGMHEALFGK